MKILILGSGLLGVTTAYELSRRGYQVAVIDRKDTCGAETSFANGGQLSYSHAEPWASPSVLPKILPWMFRSDAPLVLRPRLDWQMTKWGIQFLLNCREAKANYSCINMLRLGLYSREQMTRIRQETGIHFDFDNKGVLHIFSKHEDFEHAKKHNDFQSRFGCTQKVLTRDEVYALEPSFSHSSRTIVGGIHATLDQTGDAYKFCNELAHLCTERYGVRFHCGMTVKDIHKEGDMIVGVTTDQGDISADGYVMAMGSYSSIHLRKLGINVPIYPMKGYSVTLPANEYCPNVSLTDGTYKIVYSRLGNRLRIAGTAEFAGYNQTVRDSRIAPILRSASELFPKADWKGEISKWACLRPQTPDGPPILGPSPIRNLFLNTGHGTLGWTQAAGSATIVADIMDRKSPGILMQGLTLERYL